MNVNQILSETIEMVEKLNIEVGVIHPIVKINSRAKSIWGRCWNKIDFFEIEVSDRLLSSEAGLRNTIMHEVLHACKGGKGHKGNWKKYAEMVNAKYGMNIKRTSTAEDKGLENTNLQECNERKYKYLLRCEGCNQEFKRVKMSNFVKHPEMWRCGCGEEIKRII